MAHSLSSCLFVLCIPIFIYQVSARHTAEAKGVNSFEEFEVIIPTLTSRDGSLIKDNLHPHLHSHNTGRRRRSASRDDDDTAEQLSLSLGLASAPLHLTLHRLGGLVAPRARMEWLRNNQTTAAPLHTGCLYEGHVNGSPDSVGVFSLCDGITGTIRTSSEDIYLRPGNTGSGMTRPHVIYHHSHETESPKKCEEDHSHSHSHSHGHRHRQRRRNHRDRRRGGQGSHHGSSRGKRSLKELYRQGPKYIEVLLATDYTVTNFHGEDLVEQYLLTIMNIVDKIYHHPSLGVTFGVVVVRMLVLEDDVSDDLFVKGSAKRTLDRFCAWIYANQPPKFPYEDQHDVAVYLTRRDIGPAGYAPVTGMCNAVRSCTIAKDDGISSAFVIAHEMGHVFGMHHDGDGNDCDADPADGKIMSSMVQAAYDRFYWTNCSIQRLNMYIDDYHCLDDKPQDPGWIKYTEPFGQSWNLDEQCTQEFGKSYRLCQAFEDMDPCEYLWCSEEDTPLLCKTKRGPPLPGTPCAPGKWCMKDECVWKSEIKKNEATWSDWSSWAVCSRTCGTGVQFRYRSCRRDGTRDQCEGDEEELRLCNQDPCPIPQDFRAEQCSWVDTKKRGKKQTWLPLENRDKSKLCKLTCISKDTNDIVVSQENVIDGTWCSYDISYDICITGKCQRVGCDGKLGSDMKEDRCGVCGGFSNTCKVIADRFTQQLLARGVYHKTITLPKGARNIIVEEAHDTHHFLAIKHMNSKGFILNGRKKRGKAKIFILQGAKFVYIPTPDGDSLTAKGPLADAVEIYVFNTAKRMAVVVDFEFTVPNDYEYTPEYSNNINTDLEPIHISYVWKFKGWTECSKTCDEGETKEVYECRDDDTQKVVTDGFCSLMEKPEVHATTCNPQPCKVQTPYRWESGEWQPCSATCGLQGQQSRHVSCISNFYGKDQPVDPRYCDLTKVPEYHRRCNSHACPAQWRKTAWSKCSVTCGSGSQTRMVYCDEPRDGNNYECPGEQPPDTLICDMKSCPAKVESTTIHTSTQEPSSPEGRDATKSYSITEQENSDSSTDSQESQEQDIDMTVDSRSPIIPDNNPHHSPDNLAPEGGSGDDIDDSFEDSEDPYDTESQIEDTDDLTWDETDMPAVTQIPPTALNKRHKPKARKLPHKAVTRSRVTTNGQDPREVVTKSSTALKAKVRKIHKKANKIKIKTQKPQMSTIRQTYMTTTTTTVATTQKPVATVEVRHSQPTRKTTKSTTWKPTLTPRPQTTQTMIETTPVKTLKEQKPKSRSAENSVAKKPVEKEPTIPPADRYCRADKSVFCRLANHSNCAIPAYRNLCCVSCGQL